MKLRLKPADFEMTLGECPPGLFLFNGMVGLKSEYGDCDAYCDSGEFFWGGCDNPDVRRKLKIIPLEYETLPEDENG